jgi:hypothetical protein
MTGIIINLTLTANKTKTKTKVKETGQKLWCGLSPPRLGVRTWVQRYRRPLALAIKQVLEIKEE